MLFYSLSLCRPGLGWPSEIYSELFCRSWLYVVRELFDMAKEQSNQWTALVKSCLWVSSNFTKTGLFRQITNNWGGVLGKLLQIKIWVFKAKSRESLFSLNWPARTPITRLSRVCALMGRWVAQFLLGSWYSSVSFGLLHASFNQNYLNTENVGSENPIYIHCRGKLWRDCLVWRNCYFYVAGWIFDPLPCAGKFLEPE